MKKIKNLILIFFVIPCYPLYFFAAIFHFLKILKTRDLPTLLNYSLDNDKETKDYIKQSKVFRRPIEYALATIFWVMIILKLFIYFKNNL